MCGKPDGAGAPRPAPLHAPNTALSRSGAAHGAPTLSAGGQSTQFQPSPSQKRPPRRKGATASTEGSGAQSSSAARAIHAAWSASLTGGRPGRLRAQPVSVSTAGSADALALRVARSVR